MTFCEGIEARVRVSQTWGADDSLSFALRSSLTTLEKGKGTYAGDADEGTDDGNREIEEAQTRSMTSIDASMRARDAQVTIGPNSNPHVSNTTRLIVIIALGYFSNRILPSMASMIICGWICCPEEVKPTKDDEEYLIWHSTW
jgi:hypothetical protein